MTDIVIIGAGSAGLGAGWRLKEIGISDFLILEQNLYAGGLAAAFKILELANGEIIKYQCLLASRSMKRAIWTMPFSMTKQRQKRSWKAEEVDCAGSAGKKK